MKNTAGTQEFHISIAFPGVLPELDQTPLDRALGFTKAITGRTVLIVDNSNLLQGGRDQNFRLDMGAPVLTHLGGDELLSASMVVSTAARHVQSAYYRFLEFVGWDVQRHATLTSNERHVFENEAAVDGGVRALIRAAANSGEVDSIVVISGDGGMTNACRDAIRAGKEVFILAWAGTLHPALARAVTAHISIEEMRPLIARRFVH